VLRQLLFVLDIKLNSKGVIYELKDNLFDKLCATQSKENIITLCTYPELKSTKESRVLICDQIQDPGNMGTMIRTALSFGFDKIICSKDCVDVYNEKVIRSSQGAIFIFLPHQWIV
jgi:RNA methyltransferase, TrmH family